jgi:hypothetical protein
MKKTQLYVLALVIAALGIASFIYKWRVLHFPVNPVAQTEVWEIQARVAYDAPRGPSRVVLQLPNDPPGYSILSERYVARGYGMAFGGANGTREVQWQVRRASGDESVLYYRATIFHDARQSLPNDEPATPAPGTWDEPFATARQSLLDDVRAKSVDSTTFAAELLRRLNADAPSEEVKLLTERAATPAARAVLAQSLLADRQVAARVLYGLLLKDSDTSAPLLSYLQVFDTDQRIWTTVDASTGAVGFPPELFVWARGDLPLVDVTGGRGERVVFSSVRSLADALDTATQRLESRDRNFIAYSLLDLPLQAQEVYKILLLVPVGAFIMLLLRNIVGIKTFGTFMPVLIALAFNWTGIVPGVILFATVISLGLLVRFYMERLKLLLVPRLTAVLIVVVMLMALVSVVSNRLGIEVGLNVALFPMIIMTMTIERVSVAWEERGAGYAISQALGSIVIAALAYLVMKEAHLQHLIFVFPELLLVLLALTLVLGRYSGYRLSELFRFRALARDTVVDPIEPPVEPTRPAG